jgi:flagellar motor switch protein FliM
MTAPAAGDAVENRAGLRALAAGAMAGLDRLPLLRAVSDRLTAALTLSFRGILGIDAEVQIAPPRSVRLEEFEAGIAPAAPVAVLRMLPWGGICLAAIDPQLATTAIEVLLGGRRGASGDVARRSYTAIERAVVERLGREIVARDLAGAFALAGAAGVALDRLETTAARIPVGKPATPAVALSAEVRLGDRIGSIDFLLPYAALEPMRDRLSQGVEDKGGDGDAAWRAHLTAELPHAQVRLRAIIERRRIQAAEVLRWQAGSKLVLHRRHDEPIDIFCNDLLVLRGCIAEKDGRIALHIEERRIADDWPRPDGMVPDGAGPDGAGEAGVGPDGTAQDATPDRARAARPAAGPQGRADPNQSGPILA